MGMMLDFGPPDGRKSGSLLGDLLELATTTAQYEIRRAVESDFMCNTFSQLKTIHSRCVKDDQQLIQWVCSAALETDGWTIIATALLLPAWVVNPGR